MGRGWSGSGEGVFACVGPASRGCTVPPGCGSLLLFPPSSFPKLLPDAVPSPTSLAVPGEPAVTPDRAGPSLAGGWRPAAVVPAAAGSEPGQQESSSAYPVPRLQQEGMPPLFFPPSFFIFFPFLAVGGGFCGGTPRPAAASRWDSPAGRKAARKAEGTRDAIACRLTTLAPTRPFLQRGLGTAGPRQLTPLRVAKVNPVNV